MRGFAFFFKLLLDVCEICEALLIDTVPWAAEKRYIFFRIISICQVDWHKEGKLFCW